MPEIHEEYLLPGSEWVWVVGRHGGPSKRKRKLYEKDLRYAKKHGWASRHDNDEIFDNERTAIAAVVDRKRREVTAAEQALKAARAALRNWERKLANA